MSTCAHCNQGFSCGCQKAKAPDGKIVHKACLTKYNASKAGKKVNNDSLTQKLNDARNKLAGRG
jgi:hypothetical protein